jgi:DNA-directed RNA polymerase subunit L
MKITVLPSSYLNTLSQKLGFEKEINPNAFLPIMFDDVDQHRVCLPLVNALRRVCISEVPTIAIDTTSIKFYRNTSQYQQEVLTDRFGFIVFNMRALTDYHIPDPDLRIILSGDKGVQDPLKNTTNQIQIVNVHDHLKIYKGEKLLRIQDICPFNSPLLTLKPNEEIHATMTLGYGLGTQHTRWQGGIVMYKFATQNDLQNVQQFENNDQLQSYVGHELKKPHNIILTFESIGKLTPVDLFRTGVRTLIQNLKDLDKQFDSCEIDQSVDHVFKFKLDNQDHTLGRILETTCLDQIEHLFKQTKGDDQEFITHTMSAYRKTHPLDHHIEFILRLPPTLEKEKTVSFVKQMVIGPAINQVIAILNSFDL